MAKRICSEPGCDKPHKARDLCNTHYGAWQRSQETIVSRYPLRGAPVIERLMSHVLLDGNGCWIWTAATNPDGYGTISVKHKTRLAHKTAYELLVGPVPAGLELDHLCRVILCVNPRLEPVTHQENILRGYRARRSA